MWSAIVRPGRGILLGVRKWEQVWEGGTHGEPKLRTDAWAAPSPWTVRLKLQLSNLSLVDTSQR